MSGAPRLCEHQPQSFEFTQENLERAEKYLGRYPHNQKQSAVLPLLHLAQEQEGWVSRPALEYIADMIGVSPIKVLEVASFYTMINLKPVGKYHLQVCTTTPCWLQGSDALVDQCKKKLGISFGQTTADGLFTLTKVECLGACVNAPVVQINNDFYEDLTPETFNRILDQLAEGQSVACGSQIKRQTSAPVGGLTTLQSRTIEQKQD